MEAYQVDTAFQSLQQFDNLATVLQRVVEAAETDIFKRATALVGKVILLQEGHGVGYRHALLGRHQRQTLLGQGRMHRDGHMAQTLVKKTL